MPKRQIEITFKLRSYWDENEIEDILIKNNKKIPWNLKLMICKAKY